MPYDSNGVYTLPNAPFVPGTLGDAAPVNGNFSDIASALTRSAATTRAQYPLVSQVQDGAFLWAGTSSGTATALTIGLSPAVTAYATGQTFRFKVGSTAGGDNPTLSVNGLAARKIYVPTFSGPSQAQTGDLPSDIAVTVIYDAALDGGTGGFIVDATPLGWTVLSRATAPGSGSTLTLTIPAGYAQFRLTGYSLIPSSNAQITAQISTNNGASYDGGASDYGRVFSFQSTTLNAGQTAGTAMIVSDTSFAGSPIFFNAHLHPGVASASGARLYGITTALNSAGTEYYNGPFMSTRNSNTRITNIRFSVSAGTLAAGGAITLEGLR